MAICVRLQSELTKQQNTFKIELKELEDELLTRLFAAESNFLGDNVLVEKLESTKHTAAEIEMKVCLFLTIFYEVNVSLPLSICRNGFCHVTQSDLTERTTDDHHGCESLTLCFHFI